MFIVDNTQKYVGDKIIAADFCNTIHDYIHIEWSMMNLRKQFLDYMP